MTRPAAPLDKAVEEAREALCMFDQPCTALPHEIYQDQAIAALRDILAALAAGLPHLLAVEKAAVEMRDATVAALDDKSDAATTRFLLAMDRLDAAVRGEGKEKT